MVFQIPWHAAHRGQHLASTVPHLSPTLVYSGYLGSELTGETLPSLLPKFRLETPPLWCQLSHVSTGREMSQWRASVFLHSHASCDPSDSLLKLIYRSTRCSLASEPSCLAAEAKMCNTKHKIQEDGQGVEGSEVLWKLIFNGSRSSGGRHFGIVIRCFCIIYIVVLNPW